MKKIFLSLLAVAALASCTKSEVLYEAPQEIGFRAVAGNITKAVVDGTTYPTDLNMYVYAQTTDIENGSANYINNGEFQYKKEVDLKKLWGGTPNAYYWPNVHKLNFAGYSKSGNVNNGATVTYSFLDDSGLSITDYTPGNSDNDLMWFGNTANTTEGNGGYGKDAPYVYATMLHTCSWITFLVKGDTGTNGFTITDMRITGIDNTANVICYNVKPENGDQIQWTIDTERNDELSISLKNSQVVLSDSDVNVETGVVSGKTDGNIVVIPQLPGQIQITYKSNNVNVAPETVSASLSLDRDNEGKIVEAVTLWEPGKHYIYTITIKANEILIAPTPVDWTDGNWNITVE